MPAKSFLPAVLTIAGSDSSGGAGIQADLKTFLAHGVYGMSAITALTSQNTRGVFHVEVASEQSIRTQIDAVFTDIVPDAVKIGMIPTAAICRLIAQKLAEYDAKNVVVDPVMIASSGAALSDESVVTAMETALFSQAVLLTPNRMEAELLSQQTIIRWEDMERVAKQLREKYGTSILLKGGHIGDTATDLLYTVEGAAIALEKERLDTVHTHGTGCTYSSAITANLAKGMSLVDAVRAAKDWLHAVLTCGTPVDVESNGPLSHGVLR